MKKRIEATYMEDYLRRVLEIAYLTADNLGFNKVAQQINCAAFSLGEAVMEARMEDQEDENK